jgi:hypothetical protein
MRLILIAITTTILSGCATSGNSNLLKGELYVSETPTSEHSLNANPKEFYRFTIRFGKKDKN